MPIIKYNANGQSGRREYAIWYAMITRCYRKSDNRYSGYGGKGIKVCRRWRHSFRTFIEDMGDCPAGMSIDRIDNLGNYSPLNCRWATDKTQMNNRSDNVLITYQGRTQTLSLWADELGLDRRLLYQRIKRGWEAEAAFDLPKLKNQHANPYRM